MYQNFIPGQYPSCFRGDLPVLSYIWKKRVGESFSPPRIMHSHDEISELLLVIEGSANYTVGESQYIIQEGDIVAIGAGVLHDEDARLTADTTMVAVGLRQVRLIGLPDGALVDAATCPVLSLGDSFPVFRSVLDTIHSLLNDNGEQYAETCQFLMAGLVSLLVRLYQHNAESDAPSGKGEQFVGRIRQYIEAHYSETISLPSVSRALHINPYYLAHIFKEHTGYSPMQYVIRLRIGKAQGLLMYTDYPITQIAGMVGYDNSSHFNAMFTKYIGMSPGKYRKKFRSSKGGK